MKTILIWLFWLAVIGGVVWYLLHLHQTQVKEPRAIEIQQHETAAALALKYNAVTSWESLLPDRGAVRQPFSIEISRALIQSNGQPVLIFMDLKDVAENKGSCTVFFDKNDISNETFQLSVELKCTQEQASQLLKKTDNDFSKTYAVVVRLDEVQRPRIRFLVGGEGEEASVELQSSTDVFFAKGELLEAIRLP
jgi:hypothetical protein